MPGDSPAMSASGHLQHSLIGAHNRWRADLAQPSLGEITGIAKQYMAQHGIEVRL